jgi:hypothetical protein
MVIAAAIEILRDFVPVHPFLNFLLLHEKLLPTLMSLGVCCC